jgi:hypothetical protein
MYREGVSSSMIGSIGYDSDNSILEIEFIKGGAVWQYFDVPENIYFEFKASASVGKYFLANIKGSYPESRIS